MAMQLITCWKGKQWEHCRYMNRLSGKEFWDGLRWSMNANIITGTLPLGELKNVMDNLSRLSNTKMVGTSAGTSGKNVRDTTAKGDVLELDAEMAVESKRKADFLDLLYKG